MDSVIIAAIITAVASTVTGLLVAYKDTIVHLLRKNKRNVSGYWTGEATYTVEPFRKHSFACKLKQRGNLIGGTLTSLGDDPTVFLVNGTFFESEYLFVSVKNQSADAINYAVGILRYERNGKRLSGEFIGRSRRVEGIVKGILKLEKTDR